MYIVRYTQHVRPGKWVELEAINKKFDALEAKFKFPQPKRRLQELIGGHNTDTLNIEYEWESLTKLEATYLPYMNDPEVQALQAELNTIIDSNQTELFMVME